MKKIVIIGLLLLPILSYSQKLPKLITSPNFLKTQKDLDSVVQFTFITPIDSNLLRKWEYRIEKEGHYKSHQFSWKDLSKDWFVKDVYEWEYDESDKIVLKAHYDWYMSNGTWSGCDSEGCGKKEWGFDKNGNQILWIQSYYSSGRKWEIFEKKEWLFDSQNNMVLESELSREGYSDPYWDGNKDEYSYDAIGNQTGHVAYIWSSYKPEKPEEYNDWFPILKEEHSYSSWKKESRFYIWDFMNNVWGYDGLSGYSGFDWEYDTAGRKNSVKVYSEDSLIIDDENIYDSNGLIISEIDIKSPHLSGFYGYVIIDGVFYFAGVEYSIPLKKEYIYDSENRLVTKSVKKWYGFTSGWINDSLINYNYDPEGNMINREVHKWSLKIHEWIPFSKEVWVYNQAGLPTNHVTSYWYEGINGWMNGLKNQISYDSLGRIVTESYYEWDIISQAWNGKEKYWNEEEDVAGPGKIEYSYDERGNLIQHAAYKWSKWKNTWIGYNKMRGKKEWEFDSEGKLFSENGYDWDSDLTDWIPKQKNVFQYDEIGDPFLQYQYAWDTEELKWEKILVFSYYYESSAVIEDKILPEISVFPNPTSGLINITGLIHPTVVKVYSIHGQLLKSEFKVESSIDISDLEVGVYVMKVVSGGDKLSRVIVKR